MMKNFMIPSGATMLKKQVTPNAHSAENMHSGGFSLNKIFSNICGHPIISWSFLWPLIFYKKIIWSPSFLMNPILKKWKPLTSCYVSSLCLRKIKVQNLSLKVNRSAESQTKEGGFELTKRMWATHLSAPFSPPPPLGGEMVDKRVPYFTGLTSPDIN